MSSSGGIDLSLTPGQDLGAFRAAVRSMPKIELHAHVSGSVSVETLALFDPGFLGPEYQAEVGKLDRSSPEFPEQHTAIVDRFYPRPKSTEECFCYFQSCARVIDSLERLKICTLSVLREYSGENTAYIELRTTAKRLPWKTGGDKEDLGEYSDYVNALLGAVKEFRADEARPGGNRMEIRFLLSIDRGRVTDLDSAREQIRVVKDLCKQFKTTEDGQECVVGLDICGNPARDGCGWILDSLEEEEAFCREFPITCHTAEEAWQSERPAHQRSEGSENESSRVVSLMGKLNIRRLGHVTFLSNADISRVQSHAEKNSGICVELCPTSNRVTGGLREDLSDHHFQKWRASGTAGIAICTDDRGLFRCTLASDITDLAVAFNLSIGDVVEFQKQATQASFTSEGTKNAVLARIDKWVAGGTDFEDIHG